MHASSRPGWVATISANLYSGDEVCVCDRACVCARACACVRDVFAIYDKADNDNN